MAGVLDAEAVADAAAGTNRTFEHQGVVAVMGEGQGRGGSEAPQ